MAVAAELKKLNRQISVIYIGQKGDKLTDVPQNDANIDSTYEILAGKLRRYHGVGWRQVFDLKTQYQNLRDGFRVLGGIWQSWRLLGKLRPDAVFTRGSFVSVPVALAARLRGIPYITHDSDSIPSLANRIIAPWAAKHAVALPVEHYPYPIEKTIQVGVPISSKYSPVGPKDMAAFRRQLGLSKYQWVVCVTGGGNGAKKLNDFVTANAAYLLERYPKMALLHIAGRTLADGVALQYDQLLPAKNRARVIVTDFVNNLYVYSGAADVVIARGGATNLAEFAAQAKPCIIIPSKQLIWNVKNSKMLAEEKAVLELSEDQAEQERRLAMLIVELIDNEKLRNNLSNKFSQYAVSNSAKVIAKLILEIAA